MPSHSAKQAKVMSAIAHGWHPKGSVRHIPLKVAEEFHEADKGKKWGAHASGGRTNPFAWSPGPSGKFRHLPAGGLIDSAVPGRTDKHYVTVESGSYVFPADYVSGLGEGNTDAGFDKIKKEYGPGTKFGSRLKFPSFAGGGGVEPVPIVVAGGEVILPPSVVRRIGRGKLEKGHEILDKKVVDARKKLIKKLKSLKPPKGSK